MKKSDQLLKLLEDETPAVAPTTEADPTDGDDEFPIPSEDEMTFDDLKEKVGIKEDGISVLNLYMEKHFPEAAGETALAEALEGFKTDVEDYAMPALEKMLKHLG